MSKTFPEIVFGHFHYQVIPAKQMAKELNDAHFPLAEVPGGDVLRIRLDGEADMGEGITFSRFNGYPAVLSERIAEGPGRTYYYKIHPGIVKEIGGLMLDAAGKATLLEQFATTVTTPANKAPRGPKRNR